MRYWKEISFEGVSWIEGDGEAPYKRKCLLLEDGRIVAQQIFPSLELEERLLFLIKEFNELYPNEEFVKFERFIKTKISPKIIQKEQQ